MKLEASKFTEVGYVGRDVESMIRDLCELAVNMVRGEEQEKVMVRAGEIAEEKTLDILLPRERGQEYPAETGSETTTELAGPEAADRSGTREKLRRLLREGRLDERYVDLEVSDRNFPMVEIFSSAGLEEMDINFREMLSNMMPRRTKRRKVKLPEALEILTQEEAQRLIDMDKVVKLAIERMEHSGIIFLDEIDKIASRESTRGPDVSREGVQRDLLPIVEGSTVNTKYGMVRTDHILFIASGAFHASKPSDLIPELQGRFPIRVELHSLGKEDFVRILREPENALTIQYEALMATEGIELVYEQDAIEEVAQIAHDVNSRTENIGARRLHTVMERLLDEVGVREEIFEPASLVPWLRREPDTHKGTYGHLFVLSGSLGKTGAACLCSESALRCGAGLVTLGIPCTLNPVMEQKLTEVMTLPLPAGEGETLSSGGLEEIKEFASSVKGLAVGPGMGVNEETGRIVRALWVDVDRPMVWDADALTLLAGNPNLRGKHCAEIVVTPHPGEMGRLIDKPVAWVQENRVEAARSFAEQWGVVTVLKGARTLIAAPDGRLRINPTGNPGMAAGGMGDVLTGMIGAFLVQGMEAYDAASFAVWIHGAAGDRMAQTLGPVGFLASEVMQTLPQLFREMMEERECSPSD